MDSITNNRFCLFTYYSLKRKSQFFFFLFLSLLPPLHTLIVLLTGTLLQLLCIFPSVGPIRSCVETLITILRKIRKIHKRVSQPKGVVPIGNRQTLLIKLESKQRVLGERCMVVGLGPQSGRITGDAQHLLHSFA